MTILEHLVPDIQPHLDKTRAVLETYGNGIMRGLDRIGDLLEDHDQGTEVRLEREIVSQVDSTGAANGTARVPQGQVWHITYITVETSGAAGSAVLYRNSVGIGNYLADVAAAAIPGGVAGGKVGVDIHLGPGTSVVLRAAGANGDTWVATLWGHRVKQSNTEED